MPPKVQEIEFSTFTRVYDDVPEEDVVAEFRFLFTEAVHDEDLSAQVGFSAWAAVKVYLSHQDEFDWEPPSLDEEDDYEIEWDDDHKAVSIRFVGACADKLVENEEKVVNMLGDIKNMTNAAQCFQGEATSVDTSDPPSTSRSGQATAQGGFGVSD